MDEEEEPVLAVDLELEREEGWEAEAFWELLTRAGYVRWLYPDMRELNDRV